jgi:hypothetical protein
MFAVMRNFFKKAKSGICRVLIFAALSTVSLDARADAIDGDWCNKSGKHLKINGSNIKTPEGSQVTGDYDRHSFSYLSTLGGEHANKKIQMQLLSDDLMRLTLPDGETQNWRRCELVS